MATQKVLVLDGTTNLPKELTPNTTSAGSADEGKLVALDSSGKLDSTLLPSTGGMTSLSLTASEAISAGALVNIDSTGKVRNANATDATKPAVGIALAAIANAASGTVYFVGSANTGVTGLTAGAPVYLSTTAGASTSTAPSASGNLVQHVGWAISASEYVFTPSAGIIHG